MNIPFHPSDLKTFQSLHAAVSEKRDSHHVVITFLGSANPQPSQTQKIVSGYLKQLEPYADKAIFMIGGRGENGSVMDMAVTECYHRKNCVFIIGIEPVFDLGERVSPEDIFAFKNISLRCYAMTQLSDILIAFPGGMGTIQEIIVPLMHKKLDTVIPSALKGPRAIFITTDQPNPVTDFLTITSDSRFIPKEKPVPIIPVTVENFSEQLSKWF